MRLTEPKYGIEMLRRFSEAGDGGIEERFVPENILSWLRKRGYITEGYVPRITPAGFAALTEGRQDE